MRNNFNPWHQVTPQTDRADVVKGIIEIPKGNRAKYELDKDSGLLKLDRVLFSSMYYPHNYGFIPQSYCDDRDKTAKNSITYNFLILSYYYF